MRKYKAGDKVVLEITGINELGAYKFGNTMYSWLIAENFVDEYAKPLSEYTEKLEKKNQNKQKRIEKLVERLHRQAAEITRLLAENAQIKDDYELALKVCEDDTKARTAGQEEAWKLALKLRYMDYDDKVECFGLEYDGKEKWVEIMEKYTYTEAAAKVEAWERQKEEICVGDVVKAKDRECVEFCVTEIDDEGAIYGISSKGCVYSGRSTDNWEKTGRHIDANAWLAQIGGDCNE